MSTVSPAPGGGETSDGTLVSTVLPVQSTVLTAAFVQSSALLATYAVERGAGDLCAGGRAAGGLRVGWRTAGDPCADDRAAGYFRAAVCADGNPLRSSVLPATFV